MSGKQALPEFLSTALLGPGACVRTVDKARIRPARRGEEGCWIRTSKTVFALVSCSSLVATWPAENPVLDCTVPLPALESGGAGEGMELSVGHCGPSRARLPSESLFGISVLSFPHLSMLSFTSAKEVWKNNSVLRKGPGFPSPVPQKDTGGHKAEKGQHRRLRQSCSLREAGRREERPPGTAECIHGGKVVSLRECCFFQTVGSSASA